MNYDPPTGPIRVVSPPLTWQDPALQWWQPPLPPPQPPMNVAAIISLSAAIIAGFSWVLAIVLGPAAVIAGIVGWHQARREGRRLRVMAEIGIVLGAFFSLVVIVKLGGLQ